MRKKIKIQLAITIGITIVLLLTSYCLIRVKAQEYLSVLDEMAQQDWEWDDVEYGGLAFIFTILLMVGSVIAALAVPLLATAIVLLPFFIIELSVKKEKTQEIVTLILMILSIIATSIMLPYIAGLTYLFVIFVSASSTPMLSITIVILLSLTEMCLVANIITIIVSYAKLHEYCNELRNQQIITQQ